MLYQFFSTLSCFLIIYCFINASIACYRDVCIRNYVASSQFCFYNYLTFLSYSLQLWNMEMEMGEFELVFIRINSCSL